MILDCRLTIVFGSGGGRALPQKSHRQSEVFWFVVWFRGSFRFSRKARRSTKTNTRLDAAKNNDVFVLTLVAGDSAI